MSQTSYQFAVIGAGPAGIAAVGQLIEHGVSADSILWVDPDFQVGDLGKYWRPVMSNTVVKLFCDFLHTCEAFQFQSVASECQLTTLPGEATCRLKYIADALLLVTQNLKRQVVCQQTWVDSLKRSGGAYLLDTPLGEFLAEKVILAIGAEPRTLSHHAPEMIPLDVAMDPARIKQHCDHHDTVAVFGSSHSAVLIIRALVEAGVKRILNFNREPLKFALRMDDWILFDNTGLKGTAAIWAKEHLLDHPLPQVEMIFSDDVNIKTLLPACTKVVYAIGFKPRGIEVQGLHAMKYNPHNGIIAPGLFGVGIAFPEETVDPYGNRELSVGLWKFMRYLKAVMPLWLRYYNAPGSMTIQAIE